ncbi:MAG: tRNA uridine-5-carboxymethylaminomethyl(34) synthesis GTPase MnmE [Lachnospiraceae bacterium]|nr:tRNA uridine-5-carboxymethylaminomethyl(34) synthesis GTPase MnmE [Lachnospiraceae bacterium]
MERNETIVAISTAMTNSGIGIIRVSGDESIQIVNKVFVPKNKNKTVNKVKSYTAIYGNVVDEKEIIDECIVLVMKGPHSYTTEDVVELHCHGGVVVMRKVLNLLVKAGARPAEPGEFTKRAFLNGRIDLSKAEAVMDMIQSKNEFALSNSMRQLNGEYSDKIKNMRKEILHYIAYIESALDDPENYSLVDFKDELWTTVSKIQKDVDYLIQNSDNGRILKEGIKTAIIGKPNAGKSSLLNILVGEDRAIVTEIEGTTRDILEETISINGIPLNIIDTAGIRKTEDIVEKIGIEKAKENIGIADLILYVVDGSKELDENDYEIMELIENKKTIVLLNKIDLNKKVSKEELNSKIGKDIVELSAKNRIGIDELYEKIKDLFFGGELNFNDEIYITNQRHKAAFMNASKSLELVKNSIENEMPEDFYSIDLMNAYEELGYILGESLEDDLVNEIFSKFCMGK